MIPTWGDSKKTIPSLVPRWSQPDRTALKSLDRVLFVGPMEAAAIQVSAILERDGYEIKVAASTHEALAQIEEATPCLIIVNSDLPDIPTLALLRYLQADPVTRSIPLIRSERWRIC